MRYVCAILLLAATAQSLALTRTVPNARTCVHTVRHRRIALEEPEIADGTASDGVDAAPAEPTPSPFNNLPVEPTPTPTEPETLPQALQRIFVSEFGLQVAGVTLLFGAWIYLSSTMMTSDFWQSGLFE